jgi:hypothetical protein
MVGSFYLLVSMGDHIVFRTCHFRIEERRIILYLKFEQPVCVMIDELFCILQHNGAEIDKLFCIFVQDY